LERERPASTSSSGIDRFLKALWDHEVQKMNDHLPRERRSLEELLSMPKPSIPTRKGSDYTFDWESLRNLAELVPEEYHGRLHLPIILTRRTDLGKGTFSVSGGKLEAFLAERLLELNDKPFSSFQEAVLPLYIYRPQVGFLISKYRGLFAIAFV